VAYSRSRSS